MKIANFYLHDDGSGARVRCFVKSDDNDPQHFDFDIKDAKEGFRLVNQLTNVISEVFIAGGAHVRD